MSLLPSSPDVSPDAEPRVVGLDSEEADDLIAALSSETARRILAELHEDPAPPGELAERVGTSLQNAQYHLGKLEDAGAVEVVGTAYSEKGREMNVYGAADRPLVIFAGADDRASGLRAAVSRLFGGLAALAAGALAVQELFGESLLRRAGDDAAPGAGPTPTPEDDEVDVFVDETEDAAGGNGGDGAGDDGAGDDGAASTDTPTDEADADATPEPTPEAQADTPAGTATDTPAETPAATETPPPTEAPAADTPTPTDVPADTPVDPEFGAGAVLDGVLASGMPPGLAFFLGGATVLTLFVLWTYVGSRP